MTALEARRIPSTAWLLPASIVLTAATFILAVFIGVVDLAPSDVVAVLAGHGSPAARSIIMDIRMPRIVTGILAGVQFAVAGLLLQTITRVIRRWEERR